MRVRRHATEFAVFAVLVTVGIATSPAIAQREDFARAPQPITASELTRYGDMLLLSDEQRYAVEGLFETYLDDFAPIRAEIIELAVEHPRTRIFSGEDPFTKRLPGIFSRLRELDDRFFEDIEPLLTDEQRAMLPRLRLLRERLIYMDLDVVGRFVGHAIPDISLLLHDLERPQETMDELQPMLLDYEERLTLGLRGVFDAAVRLCGTGDDDMADVLIDRVKSLRAFNRRSYDRIAANLSGVVARRLERDFFARAYGSAYDSGKSHYVSLLQAALERDDLDDAERDAIQRLLNERKAHSERTLRELLEIAEEDFIYHAGPRGAVPRREDMHERFNAARNESMERDLELRGTMREVLGEERAGAILRDSIDHGGRSVTTIGGLYSACGVTSTATRIRRPMPPPAGGRPRWTDPLVAHPIELTDLDDFALLLELQGDIRRTLVDVHRTYTEWLDDRIKPLRQEWGMLNFGRMNESPEERAARINQLPELRSRMRALIAQADERFFDEVRDSLGMDADDPRLERARQLRRRAHHHIWTIPQPDNPNRAAEADIVLALARAELSRQEWEEIEDLVEEYERRAIALLLQRYEAVSGADVRGGHGGFLTQEEMAERTRRAELPHERHRDLVVFVQEAIDAMADALPEQTARRVLDAFYRQAYPLAYDDPMSMEDALAQAASLPDLTGDQRQSIAELRSEYTAAYADVRRGIIEASAAFAPDLRIAYISMRIPEEKARAQQRFAQIYEKLTHERAAINRRALRSLRTTLRPAQLRGLDLPDVE